jgi:glutamate:Na+ symporter, ESS family
LVGGLLVALLWFGAYSLLGVQVRFDTSRQEQFMVMFFASIGLNADLRSLRKGGRSLALFLGVAVGLLLVQNTLGVVVASTMGLNSAIGLRAGSIRLSDGHGTGVAWGTVFSERYSMSSATELTIACATFGLVLGGLIGGPVARFLIAWAPAPTHRDNEPLTAFEQPAAVRLITAPAFIEMLALFAVCLAAGSAFELPAFVCVLLVGVILAQKSCRV